MMNNSGILSKLFKALILLLINIWSWFLLMNFNSEPIPKLKINLILIDLRTIIIIFLKITQF